MNVQQLIEKYKKLEGVWDAEGAELARRIFIQDLKQLDEPQKAEIPMFVADYIEKCKKELSLRDTMNGAYRKVKVHEWLLELDEDGDFINQNLFALAWIFGYTVEKEKRYKVVMPNVSSSGGVLTRIKHDDSWIWIDTLGTIVEGRTHTRKELEEANFGWVFDCEGIEVEEVE